jgi:RNA polymerase sigma factor (sigma-70 family)
VLFEDLRKPARVMIGRAYGSAIGPDGIEDVYANAWTSALAALKGREREMDDEELRAYVLAAVAGHASKEMRRRSRRPTSALEDAHAQVLADGHQPLPEERAVGSESGSVARDVLASLPPRRRAVMLLRYGWGLSPKEICSIVAGLSPRAYRKEIGRGVEQMIERLGQVESGEWCRSRQPIIRDYVAGTASPEQGRQAIQHLTHCRGCTELVARLHGHLHELGGLGAASVTGGLEGIEISGAEGLARLFEKGREGGAALAERTGAETGTLASQLASSGGARGAGAAGFGIAAKIAGIGVAGKAAIACIGAGVAATACVATGVLPGAAEERAKAERASETRAERVAAGPDLEQLKPVVGEAEEAAEPAHEPGSGGGESQSRSHQPAPAPEAVEEPAPVAPEGAPVHSPAPTAPPVDQEFGMPAAASAPSGGGTSSGSGGTSAGSGASGDQINREFGP